MLILVVASMPTEKAALFSSGGQVGITEFSWNPTNMTEYRNVDACERDWGKDRCFGQKAPDDKTYHVPK